MTVSIPQIEIPHFVFGDNGKGVGRGPGKEGDIIGRDPKPGEGGNKAGDSPGDGINISIDLEAVLKFMEEDLSLPRMKPKPNETFEEVKIKYNDISKSGPQSLRHTRRTMKEAMKRLALSGDLDNLHTVIGSKVPMKLITPINSDRRYRQYSEIKVPTSNAVIFFARDCSGSMDDYRCDIVSDMSWWLDCWIRRFYDRVDRCYFVHDTLAKEVDEETFYNYRFGGGTMCSSAFSAIAEQLQNRYPPQAYNVYVFYFSDGDNWTEDNQKMINIINEELNTDKVNMIGVSQICSWNYEGSIKKVFDNALKTGQINKDLLRTTYIGPKDTSGSSWGFDAKMAEEDRNTQIIQGIRDLLGNGNSEQD